MTTPHVVIIGGGFGGLAAARALAGADALVTLLDRRNHHLFQPLLYQVATAGLNPSDIAYPIRAILSDQANTQVLLADVVAIDPSEKTIDLADGATVRFDYLVVAAGATHSYFGHEDWEQYAPGLKTIEDALEIRRRVLVAFECAEKATEPAEREEYMTFVVVGGGPTGVETAGALAEIAFKTLTDEFRSIDPSEAKVILLEGLDRVLHTYPESLSVKAERQLAELGVDVRTGVMVRGVTDSAVETDTPGTIRARTVIWGAGVEASPLATMLGAGTDRAGRVTVAPDLSIPGHRTIFAVGDMAHAESGGRQIPGIAQAAIQSGRHAGKMIRADLDGHPRRAFRYRNKGELATIGRSAAVGQIGPLELSGWAAWMTWWAIHLFFLIGFRSRVIVMFSWAWSYATFQRGARLITGPWRPGRDEPVSAASS